MAASLMIYPPPKELVATMVSCVLQHSQKAGQAYVQARRARLSLWTLLTLLSLLTLSKGGGAEGSSSAAPLDKEEPRIRLTGRWVNRGLVGR